MKKSCIFVLCAIVLFTIIEAKPNRNGGYRGGGGGDENGDGGQGGGGYGGGNGGQGGGGGGNGGGNGGRGGGHRGGNDYDDYDYSYIYRHPCRGRGCKTNYIGNGRQNTNTVYMYD